MNRYVPAPRPLTAILAALAGLSLLAVACTSGEEAPPEGLARVTIGNLVVDAEVPVGEAIYKGLGERDSLPQDRGMLFVFPETGPYAIWMKGMRFAIDIIWISEDLRVVDLAAEVQPEPGAPDAQLKRYYPREPAGFVLEVGAGLAAQKGVEVGDTAQIELPGGQ